MNIAPIGFLVVGASSNGESLSPKFIPVEHKCSIDKLLDYIPDLFDKMNQSIKSAKQKIDEQEVKEEIKKAKKDKEKNKDTETTYEFEYTEEPEDDD